MALRRLTIFFPALGAVEAAFGCPERGVKKYFNLEVCSEMSWRCFRRCPGGVFWVLWRLHLAGQYLQGLNRNLQGLNENLPGLQDHSGLEN